MIWLRFATMRRHRPSHYLLFVLGLAACSSGSSPSTPAGSGSDPGPAPAKPPTTGLVQPKKPDPIAALWPDGCFMTVTRQSDPTRCAQPRRPYSTFKLANALIGVDAGVYKSGDDPMRWDRKKVPDENWFFEEWRQPQTLHTAFTASAVPYFRTLALELGESRMTAGLKKLDYGNQDIGGGLDKFWLSGDIRISAVQQIQFVTALARGQLGVSKHAQDVVREISVISTNGDTVLHGKTGTGPIEGGKTDDKRWLLWQVGWVEHGAEIKPYAAWMEVTDMEFKDARAIRQKRIDATLAALGWYETPATTSSPSSPSTPSNPSSSPTPSTPADAAKP